MDNRVDLVGVASKRGTLASTVYDRLRQDVLSGSLAAGERLRIETLCKRYDVGASPVREALNRLVSDRLVQLEDQKGFRVASVSLAELEELTRTRCLVNSITITEAIERGDDQWEEKIVVAFHRMVKTARNGTDRDEATPDGADAHRAFHSALIEGCESHWLIMFSETLFDAARRYQKLSMGAGATPRDIEAEHRPIMDAVLNRDKNSAVRLLNEHVALTAEIVTSLKVVFDQKKAG